MISQPKITKAIGGLLILLFLAGSLSAQPEFDKHLSYQQIQSILDNNSGQSIEALRNQALAWYHWAHYEEKKTGNSENAFLYLDRSAERFLKAGDTAAYQRVRCDLADRLVERGLFDQAFRIYQEALTFYNHNKSLYPATHVLTRLNRACLSNKDTAEARKYREMYLENNKILQDTAIEIIMMEDEIAKLQKRQEFRGARGISFRALKMAERKELDDLINWAQFSYAENCRFDRDFKTALEYYHLAEKSGPTQFLRRDIYHGLSKTYTAMDSLRKANYYAIRYAQLGDTLLDMRRLASLQELIVRYGTEEQQKFIESLKEKNTKVNSTAELLKWWLYTLVVALIAIFLSFYFILRESRNRLRSNKVIAAQTAALNQQHIRELEDKLKIDTMQSMLVGQESERRRIAQDLHDSVGGLLAATKMQLEKLSEKNSGPEQATEWLKIKTLLDNTVAETRHIARNMQPNTLLQFGLATALRDLTSHFRAEGMPKITFQQFGDFSNLEHNLALNCYRIVQELLQNSLKHAKAKEILVQITCSDNQLELLVEDDGIGYAADAVKKGMGTDNIAHRVQFLKGEINVQSSKGQGASTLVTIPLP
jgi:signal transduction histidine kinase